MARYTGPVCRLCRRAGEKLFLKGERCSTPKCAIERRGTAPGQHGQRRRRQSDFAIQLREKQKARFSYGIMERQFRRMFDLASHQEGVTGELLLQMLERRLDNVVQRLGFAESRPHARQLVRHGHFTVNGQKLDIPSYQAKEGDVIGWKAPAGDSVPYLASQQRSRSVSIPSWLSLDPNTMTGRVLSLPSREHVDIRLREQAIVEFYSR